MNPAIVIALARIFAGARCVVARLDGSRVVAEVWPPEGDVFRAEIPLLSFFEVLAPSEESAP